MKKTSQGKKAPLNAAPKPPTNAQRFVARLDEIMAGKFSLPEDQFEPLEEFKPIIEIPQGELKDPTARELYTFAHQLLERMRMLPLPKNPAAVDALEKAERELTEQIRIATQLFEQRVRAEFPDAEGDVEVRRGWIVVTSEDDDEYFERMAGRTGLPIGLARAMLARQHEEREHQR